jgi:Domain of unknown function (DUF4203)
MLPQAYELPAALFLFLGGAVSCFAGYRLFKLVLAIYGFILGAGLASSAMGASNTVGMIIAALAGGIVGALILVFAYFIGIALVGAGLGALLLHFGWGYVRTGDPPALAVIAMALVGAISAMVLQRYVIVVATAFGGAWTMILGGLALAGDRLAARTAHGESVWILYPTAASTARWVPIAWVALGVVGAAVQLGITGRKS